MKSMLTSILVLAALVVGTTASADYVRLVEGRSQSTYLPSCGGTASLNRLGPVLTMLIIGNDLCSNIMVNGRLVDKSQTISGLVLSGSSESTVVIRSNSGKHSDTISVTPYVAPVYRPRADVYLSTNGTRFASLPGCGGTVELVARNGQVNLVFREVDNCSNFDILSNDGQSISYPNQKLQGQNPNRFGSFTLPSRVIDFGHNGVVVVVKSNSGKTETRIYVQFYAF